MKIIELITELNPGGAEKLLVDISLELKKRGHEVLVVSLQSPDENSSIVKALHAGNIPIKSLQLDKFHLWRIFKLRKILHQFSPDIIHAHLIHANLLSRFFVPRASVPLINTVHIAERRSNKNWHFLLDRLTFSRCSCQTAVSRAAARFHARKIGRSPGEIKLIYNGITPPDEISEARISELRHEWGLENCAKVLGSVGRLVEQKGYDILLEKLSDIAKIIPTGECWALVILGEGPERAKLEALAAAAPENVKCVLPGFREDAPDCIGAFDLFLMPSRYEGFGLTFAETMAHGLPIIASDIDSLPELMNIYRHGRCIDFNDTGALCEALRDFIDTDKTVRRCPFTFEKMFNEYLLLYENLCKLAADNDDD